MISKYNDGGHPHVYIPIFIFFTGLISIICPSSSPTHSGTPWQYHIDHHNRTNRTNRTSTRGAGNGTSPRRLSREFPDLELLPTRYLCSSREQAFRKSACDLVSTFKQKSLPNAASWCNKPICNQGLVYRFQTLRIPAC